MMIRTQLVRIRGVLVVCASRCERSCVGKFVDQCGWQVLPDLVKLPIAWRNIALVVICRRKVRIDVVVHPCLHETLAEHNKGLGAEPRMPCIGCRSSQLVAFFEFCIANPLAFKRILRCGRVVIPEVARICITSCPVSHRTGTSQSDIFALLTIVALWILRQHEVVFAPSEKKLLRCLARNEETRNKTLSNAHLQIGWRHAGQLCINGFCERWAVVSVANCSRERRQRVGTGIIHRMVLTRFNARSFLFGALLNTLSHKRTPKSGTKSYPV